jgi:YesN/AraC family two-component response regulator
MNNARAALDIHVDHFAIKPIEITELLEAVRRLAGWRADAQGAGE